MIKSRRMRGVEDVALIRKKRDTRKVLAGKPERKGH
jgi:hypothetical protein